MRALILALSSTLSKEQIIQSLELALVFFVLTALLALYLLARLASRKNADRQLLKQIAHDIRSPLSALNMILRTLGPLHEEKSRLIQNSVARINDIAQRLLVEQKKASELEPLWLPAQVEAMVAEKRLEHLNVTDISLECELTHSDRGFVRIAARDFACMLSNLINNACEALHGAGVVLVRLSFDERAEQLHVSVIDNGKGVPTHRLAELGKKEGESFGKSQGKSGFGLGLFHARRIMNQLGGTLNIHSTVNEGTEVTLSFPLAQPIAFRRADQEYFAIR